MDAQGGYAKVKSFKDTMDAFGDANQYVKDQVGAQTWAQWYINVLAGTKDKVSLVATPLKTVDGTPVGIAGGTSFAIPKGSKNPAAACAFAIKVTSPEAWQAAGKARAAKAASKGSLVTGLFTGSPVADQAIRKEFVKPTGNAGFDEAINTSYAALDHTFSFGGSAVSAEIDQALQNAVTVSLSGEKSPEQALSEAQATAMRAWEQSAMGKKR